MANPRLIRRAALAGSALAAAFAVDFITKYLILNVIMVPPRTIEIAPFFNLTLGFNPGVSFGMFGDFFVKRPLFLAGMTGSIAAGLFILAVRTTKRIDTFAFGLIAGGAVGNVVDRVRRGAVTDFLDFHVGDWHWPAFNMADVMIVVGVVLLITGSLWPTRSIQEGFDRTETR
ncbi:signal peptidase II [Enhydrobacter aerosaccus]|uniref:Lipoprotein signal peptidase n=1 Tax=Enhydrobacter aerosaccus TaxID=225324 RepID=A0A1T4SKK0_9HYPH|nr:signal peptidase II [Enhydrobacter aerosaccus]SKA28705.1 signal peptidase II [Enhydrobacter aerosaccus]